MISSWRKRRAEKNGAKKHEMELNGVELITPRHFLCPISLDLMKDPVTLSSGMTFDRVNIERWIEGGNHTCPVTNQVLTSLEPIPSHAIRKMIQDWCVENKSYGIERIPTPRIPVSAFQASELLMRIEAMTEQEDAKGCKGLVSKIKSMAKESERNKKSIASNGASKVLSATFEAFSKSFLVENVPLLDEILSTLTILSQPLNGEAMFSLGSASSLSCIVWFSKSGDLSARRNAILVLREILSKDQRKINDALQIEGALEALVKVIKESICPTTTKAALLTIYYMVSNSSPIVKKNAIKEFVEMGLVETLFEMLIESDKSICEKALGVLDGLFSFEEGIVKGYENALTVPVLVKKLFRVSDLATEFSVSILWKLGKNEKNENGGGVVVEALEVGAFQKVLLLLQVGCTEITKEKATELLKMLNLHRFKAAECIDSVDFKDLKRPF